MMLNTFIELDDTSRFRQALMGLGIFGVLFSHWFGFQDIDTGIVYTIAYCVNRLMFTEGLLFLSGFGLYYSYSKNSNIRDFYKRRVMRLYIPFLLLSLGLYLFFLFCREDYGLADFFTQITTTYFWWKGNFGGMWYVSLSLALYLIFPLLYKFIFWDKSKFMILMRALLLVCFAICCCFLLSRFAPEYYELVAIGLGKVHFFIIGLLWGYIVKNNILGRNGYFVTIVISFSCYAFFTYLHLYSDGWFVVTMCNLWQKLFFIPVVCICLNLFTRTLVLAWMEKILSWFGKYSLELYILHLHIYMFFKFSGYFDGVPSVVLVSTAMLLSILLCVPTNRLISKVTGKIYAQR